MAQHLTPVTFLGDRSSPVYYPGTAKTAAEWVESTEPIRRATDDEFALVDGTQLGIPFDEPSDSGPVVEPVGDAGGPSDTVGDPPKLSVDASQTHSTTPDVPSAIAGGPTGGSPTIPDTSGAIETKGGKTASPAVGKD